MSLGKKRRLTVPSSLEEFERNEFPMYMEPSDEEDLEGYSRGPINSRSLPSTRVLVSSLSDKKEPAAAAPLLLRFYEMAGMPIPEDAIPSANSTDDINLPDEHLDDIDSAQHSKLSLGQHRRYLQLTDPSNSERRTDKERRELRTLRNHVKSEQTNYWNARKTFYEKHRDRFCLGLSGIDSPLVRSHFHSATSSRKKFQQKVLSSSNLPVRFGPCRQTLSLPKHLPTRARSTLDVPSLDFRLVSLQEGVDQLPLMPSSIVDMAIPAGTGSTSALKLEADPTALTLAVRHSATLLVSSEVLACLLLNPGGPGSMWKMRVGVIEDSNIQFLETPLVRQACVRVYPLDDTKAGKCVAPMRTK